jgi:quercetin dioxygenase-like cupin family protein
MQPNTEHFQTETAARGYTQWLTREWPADAVVETHTHPFDAAAVITAGEMWLTVNGQTQHLAVGGSFEVLANTPHAEKYGAQGATFFVARRERA